jgi:hypothetical protein
MSIDKPIDLDSLGPESLPFLKNALDKISEDAAGWIYTDTLPTTDTVPLGKMVVYDNGSTRRVYFRTGDDEVRYVNLIDSDPTSTDADIANYGTSGTTGTAVDQVDFKIRYGYRTVSGTSNATVTGLPFTDATTYAVTVTISTSTTTYDKSCYAVRNSGSQITIYNGTSDSQSIMWMAMGT